MNSYPKLIRITTIPGSLKGLLKGQLRFMSENGFEVVAISSKGEVLKEVSQIESVKTIAVEMTRTISPIQDLKSVWKLYRIFKREKPTIVHTHTPKAGIVGMLAAKLAGVPHRLHTVAGLPLMVIEGERRRLLEFVERKTSDFATMVYPNSFGLYNVILENKYAPKEKLKVIGNGSSNGIDMDYFNPETISRQQRLNFKNSLNIGAEDFVYLYVGRIVRDKGINELVESFDLINKAYPNTKLILVGTFERELDPIKPEIEKIIKSNCNILTVGYQLDVRPFFAIADILTFPSYREGFPNVVMQAAAMRLNSIVSDINGCNEIIKDGENGWIVPVRDIERLYNRMKWCLLNQTKSKEMGFKSREVITNEYGRLKVWRAIHEEYLRLLNNTSIEKRISEKI